MFSQEIIQKARNSNLYDFLINRGYILTKEGNQFRVNGYQGLIIQESKWYQHSTGKGGNPIDFFMQIENKSFKESITILTKETADVLRQLSPFDYMLIKRKIDKELLYDCFALNLIKENLSTLYFFGYENQENLACLGNEKCISWINTINNKKGELKNSDKNYSFSIPDYNNHSKIRTLIIAESPIDILSIATLEKKRKSNDFYQTYKIALCGLYQTNLYQRVKKIKPNKIHLALDNDLPGQEATKKIKNDLEKIAPIKVIEYNAKDPNELLTNCKL